MPQLGHFSILLCLFLSSYAILADVLGSRRRSNELVVSGRNATIGSLICLTVAMAALWTCLAKSDFSVRYVAEHTSRALPLAYKVTALWAGAAGSLLLWLWLQVGFVTFAFRSCRLGQRRFCAGARAIANMVTVFFSVILIWDKNPFALSLVAPQDGAGLNPLLQHPAMVLHPPALFVGYAALAIPFAWTFALLGEDSQAGPTPLFRQMHSWILFAWMFLTVGIVLGAWWAYEELGWGGYWAWDPVENASLMPWLTATALLHCARTYKPNSPIARWLILLTIATFSLCIFGTFLTRYGLVSSVHAFPEPGLGVVFLVLLVHIWVIAAVLLIRRWRLAKATATGPQGRGHKYIIANNWLMVFLTFVILAGTLFPFFSGLFAKQKITLKAEYFTKITAPGGLAVLLLLGVCPHLLRHGINKSWRTIGAALAGVIAVVVWVVTRQLAPACLVLCSFVAVNLVADVLGRHLARPARSATSLAGRPSLRWCGARIVHCGVLLAYVGIAGSGGYDLEEQAAIRPHEKVRLAGYDIVYDGLSAKHGPNFTAVTANLAVHKGEKVIAKLHPSRAFYARSDQRTSEVDIRRTLAGDLYVALTDVNAGTGLINLTVLVKPLINWIWIGTILSVLGAILVLIGSRGRPAQSDIAPSTNVE